MKRELEYLEKIQGIILMLFDETQTKISFHKLRTFDKDFFDDLIERLEEYDQVKLLNYVNPTINLEFIKSKLVSNLGEDLGLKYFTKHYTDETIKRMSNRAEPITKFQNSASQAIFQSLYQTMKMICKDKSYKLVENLVLVSTTTFRFNAVAVNLDENSKPIIVFEDEVFTYCHLLSKILSSCIPFEDGIPNLMEDPIKNHISNNPIIPTKFLELVLLISGENSVRTMNQFLRPDENKIIHKILTDGMEYFVMGHEIGHFVKDHFNTSNSESFNFDFDEILSVANSNWELEFEADIVGAELMIECMKREAYPTQLILSGIESLFAFMHIIDEAKALLVDTESNELLYRLDVSHPPALLRIEHIRNKLSETGFYKEEILVGDNFKSLVYDLWQLVKPMFIKLSANRKRL